jgi:hypothetical protein
VLPEGRNKAALPQRKAAYNAMKLDKIEYCQSAEERKIAEEKQGLW